MAEVTFLGFEGINKCYGCGHTPCATPGHCAEELGRIIRESTSVTTVWTKINTPLTTLDQGIMYVNGDEGSFIFNMPYTITPQIIDLGPTEEEKREIREKDIECLIYHLGFSREKAEKTLERWTNIKECS